MDELVNQIASRTGLSQEQAQQAADAAIEFIKSKLPEPFASQVDGLLSGGGDASGLLGQLGNLGGMLGGQ
jgi:hypothetical protein